MGNFVDWVEQFAKSLTEGETPQPPLSDIEIAYIQGELAALSYVSKKLLYAVNVEKERLYNTPTSPQEGSTGT